MKVFDINWTFMMNLICIIFALFSFFQIAQAKEVPYLLQEDASPVTKAVMRERLPKVIEHQNNMRRKLNLRPLDTNLEVIMGYPHNIKNLDAVSVPADNFSSWTTIDMRGDIAVVSDFDDHNFLNHVYLFSKESDSVQVFTLGEYALSKISDDSIPLFRYMGKIEFKLWITQDLQTLLAYKPGGEGYWGFNELNTHTSPFKPWEGANLSPDLACGKWVVNKGKLIEWSKNNKIVFGLTGERFSKDYEIIILSSVWDELVRIPFENCSP
jgi:hypothetical protein